MSLFAHSERCARLGLNVGCAVLTELEGGHKHQGEDKESSDGGHPKSWARKTHHDAGKE